MDIQTGVIVGAIVGTALWATWQGLKFFTPALGEIYGLVQAGFRYPGGIGGAAKMLRMEREIRDDSEFMRSSLAEQLAPSRSMAGIDLDGPSKGELVQDWKALPHRYVGNPAPGQETEGIPRKHHSECNITHHLPTTCWHRKAGTVPSSPPYVPPYV